MSLHPKQSGFHPTLPAVLFLLWSLLIPLFVGDVLVNADGDPARHLRHGVTILAQGDVIRHDPFSFTRPGEPVVGFEYGSQVMLALAYKLGGTTGMVVLATLLIAGLLAALTRELLRRGVDPLLVLITTTAVAVLTNIHWLARPHLFSWPLTLLLLFWLEAPKRPPLWAFAILFAVWANLHGAFVFGWVMILMYALGHLLEWATARDPGVRRLELAAALGLAPALLVTIPATMVNPYGWRLTWHVVEFFRIPWLQEVTEEFLSPNFHTLDLKPFLLAILGLMVILAHRPRPHWTHLVCITGTAGMALLYQRNIAQFGLIAMPLLALDLREWWGQAVARRPFVTRFGASARSGMTWPWAGLASVFLLLLARNHGRIGGRQLVNEGFDPAKFPVAAVEWGRDHQVEGRVFNDFVWGGYLLWAWPEMKVFIDPGTDFYGGRFLHLYPYIDNLRPGWRDSLDTFAVNLVLIRTGSALASELLREPAWIPRYCDRTAVLLSRSGATTPPDSAARSSCTRPQRRTGG